jgi:hypothetical protein
MIEEKNQGKTLRLWGIGSWEPNEWIENMFILDQNKFIVR